MSDDNQAKVEAEKQMIREAQEQGNGAVIKTYVKLSGPGWLQSAITLGGGSLAGSLYIGIIAGYELLWLQPLMMIFGILMLSVIGYVTLSTGKKPFQAINDHINPVLGWAWLGAALIANLVWAMPQFSLGAAALQQNLFPGLLGGDAGKYICVVLLLGIGGGVVWFYDSGSKGIKLFELILKGMVGVVVLSFFGVVLMMTFSEQGLPWGTIIAGFIPDFGLLSHPAAELQAIIDQSSAPEYWTKVVMDSQRDRMLTAAATAVGINMTFLLPYSMLRKGWGREHRGLATFDLSTGLFIPFLIATSCVVIAAASQFHGKFDEGLIDPAKATDATAKLQGKYAGNLDARMIRDLSPGDWQTLSGDEKKSLLTNLPDVQKQEWLNNLPDTDKQLAAMLIGRDAFQLANSLENLTGSKAVSQYVFGIGVVGMAISTIIILMLINGFCVSEMIGKELSGMHHRIGSLLPGITGALGFLFLWGNDEARFWLAVPTSVFGMILLPIAYVTFFFMMNSKNLLGDALPQGGKRIALNIFMVAAIVSAGYGAGIAIHSKAGTNGFIAVGILAAAAIIAHFVRPPKPVGK